MFVGPARQLCPELKTVPYEFEKYAAVSETCYRIYYRYTKRVEIVSCDEAFLEFPDTVDAEAVANGIRGEVLGQTGCPCSELG